jgi:outer membrane lipoprotein carrier protein
MSGMTRGAFALAATLAFAPAGAAAPPSDALQRFVEKVDTLSASFEQVQRDEQGQLLQKSEGKVWLARPGKFRWSYEKPYSQLMVCDGKTLWLYDPDLAQVTVRPAGATLQGTPAQLLTDRASLEKHFKVEDAGADQGGGKKLRLLPKAADSDFKSVELWLIDGVPQRMRFADQLGGESDVTFRDIRTNGKVDATLFAFEVPKGTEIIQGDESLPKAPK